MPSSSIDSGAAKAATYVAPRLKIYGDAKALTASGTGANAENGTQPSCVGNPGKKPC